MMTDMDMFRRILREESAAVVREELMKTFGSGLEELTRTASGQAPMAVPAQAADQSPFAMGASVADQGTGQEDDAAQEQPDAGRGQRRRHLPGRKEGEWTADEVATEAGITRAAVLLSVKAGKLLGRKVRSGGRWGYSWVFSERAVRDWLASRGG